jgi:hypothetical protein
MHEKLYDEGFLSFINSSPREWILTEKGRNFLQDYVEKLTSPENEKSIINVENKTFLTLKKFYASRSSFYYFNENLLREEFANMRYSQCENSEFYREFYTEILDVLTTVAEDRMIIKIEEKIPQLIKTIVKKPDDIWKIDDYDVMIKVVSLLPNSSYSLHLDPEVIDSYTSKQNDLYLLIFLSTTKLYVLIPPIDIRRTFNNEVIFKADKRFSPSGKLYLLSLYPKQNRLDLKVGEKSLVVNKFINSLDIPVLRKLTLISAHNAMQILFLAGNLNRLSQMRSFSRDT